MKFDQFRQKIKKILDKELPDPGSILKEGREITKGFQIGRTAFMNKMGVDSELEYKRRCIQNNQIMFHAHIGMNTWETTTDALTLLFEDTQKAGFIMDRVGICLDRRMGLPKKHRRDIPAETGPMLETEKEWMQLGQIVPIQPHMGDFMIGFPASVENTLLALKAGVTTIGNLSQFFSHEVPMWKDRFTTTLQTAKALAVMGSLRDKGVMVHSYLEDGFGALFGDCATVAGWALLERYIVENLFGAKLAHCIGGLTSDPVKRAGWVFALKEIHAPDCIGSMFYGDTISFSADYTENSTVVAEYLSWDIMAQLECPTGHAVLPLPVTEALRIPSAEEITEAQRFGRRIEKMARRLWPHMDFGTAREFSEKVLASGRSVFDKALEGLKAAGLDITDPVRMLYVLKELGPFVFEEMFGVGKIDDCHSSGRQPVVPTDVHELSASCIRTYRHLFDSPGSRGILGGRRLLIASTDVHAHAVMIISQLLAGAGAEVINMGAEVDPDQVAATARAKSVGAVLISTHNGMALEYAGRLKAALDSLKMKIPVVMGGILNQKLEDTALPVDVAGDLKKMGFYPCPRLENRFKQLLEFQIDGENPKS